MNYKKQIVDIAHIMEQKGFATAKEGNLSIIDRNSNKMYITPTAQRKLTMTEDMVVVLDAQTGEQIEGEFKASSEYRLHLAALHSRPDCTAAIHSHCTFLTAYSFLGQPIDMGETNNIALYGGPIPCIAYGLPGTDEIARDLPQALHRHNICLLSNHGVICVEKTLDDCAGLLEMIEGTVKTHLVASQIGTPALIPKEAVAILRSK